MKAFIVYWHPEPKSFNSAMFATAQTALREAGWEVETSDLYAMGLDPISSRKSFQTVKDPNYFKPQLEEMHASEFNGFAPDLEAEIKKLETCDLMIWQFPLWWFSLPAAFKGWVDRTFARGRIYGGGKAYETGPCKGKRALLSLTTGSPARFYTHDGENGDLMSILRPIHRGMLQFVGFDVLAPQIVHGPVRLSEEQRHAELQRFAARLAQINDEALFEVGRY